jgi:flavin reductase (DIM6/NTAB) family NADH-FMN oxidoreductase RutF
MLKKIGNQNALYPTPATVIGATVDGKVNFINIAHVGILNASAPHLISFGMNKTHHTNKGIRENKTFSVNILSQDFVTEIDYVGLVSGASVDKSGVFSHFFGELKTAPIIGESMLSMECSLQDIYETRTHDVVIGRIEATYASDDALTNGKIDLSKVRPVLFDMNSVQYWSLGKPIGNCWRIGRNYQPKK